VTIRTSEPFAVVGLFELQECAAGFTEHYVLIGVIFYKSLGGVFKWVYLKEDYSKKKYITAIAMNEAILIINPVLIFLRSSMPNKYKSIPTERKPPK